MSAASGPFPKRSLVSLLDDQHRNDVPHYARAREISAAQTVSLPELPTGRHLLTWLPVVEVPPDAHWEEASYLSVTPWICEFRDVLVHSDAGIVCAGGTVVADTMGQTNGDRHHYRDDPDGVTLYARAPVAEITGRCLSLLNFSPENYYHWTIDGLGRLAAADEEALESCSVVLLPELTREFQIAGFALTGLGRTHKVRTVAPDETLWVESLVVPWSMTGDHRPHPSLRGWFTHLASAVSDRAEPLPRRLYVDRRASQNRRLVNEDAVIAALARMGFTPIPLEGLRLAEQIALFRNAEIIVAPHGAGLANLVYAHPGCHVVELHMASYVHWCFRRLAAVFQLPYDCVAGQQLPDIAIDTIHAQSWAVSITHLLGAVEQALARMR